ncbi:MAG: DNA-protecting protein DprA [Acidobacteria bacterium]|nr:DNA-protecting protein DprA [Acidobacteriota bacterium]MBI3425384.1 DNA-protecting protein DprA [Acidobacteriota bacterium]
MRADLADWIALNMIRGIGPRTANQLLAEFGTPAQVFAASRLWLEKLGLKPNTIQELHDSSILEKANAEIERLEALHARVITLEDEDYPALLREIHDPPIALYVRGDLPRAYAQPCLAVVGSRRCSTYGVNTAQMLARDLAANGLTIVSGMARGIDAAAHRGALEVAEAGGQTIAIVGTGLETIYPKEHKGLEAEIMAHGAVISEFPLGTPPLPQNFPYRNRILSGLCFGVLVVEAAEHSGSLITARLAYEQGREVFAVPGNITSQTSFGPNYLIKDGAKLVQQWRDVVEELPLDMKEKILDVQRLAEQKDGNVQPLFPAVEFSASERQLLEILSADVPAHIDQLLMSSGLASAELMNALLSLEMKDRIRELPGKSFIKRL